MDGPIISAENVCFSYGSQRAVLDDVSLRVQAGRRVALLGANGAGKSTLLLLLNGTLAPASGKIRINGRVVSRKSSELAQLHREVGIVLQDPDDQLFAPTVEQDVAFGLLNLGSSEGHARATVKKILDALRISGLARRPVHELSLGEKKRVALAGVLVLEPKVILLDEPNAGLDHDGTTALLDLLEELYKGCSTVIITTHDTDFAYQWANEVAVLASGRMAAQGEATAVLAQVDLSRRARLRLPWIIEMAMQCRAICPKLNDAPMPRDRDELFQQMRIAMHASEQIR